MFIVNKIRMIRNNFKIMCSIRRKEKEDKAWKKRVLKSVELSEQAWDDAGTVPNKRKSKKDNGFVKFLKDYWKAITWFMKMLWEMVGILMLGIAMFLFGVENLVCLRLLHNSVLDISVSVLLVVASSMVVYYWGRNL